MAKTNAFSEMLSFKGRIGRGEWWLIGFGFSILQSVAAFAAATVLIGAEHFGPALREHPVFHQIQLALAALLFWPILAASVKRAHDRSGPGFLPFVYMVANLTFLAIQVFQPQMFEIDPAATPTTPQLLLGLVGIAFIPLAIWLVISLGLLPGKKGANRYGPSPKGSGRHDYQAPRID